MSDFNLTALIREVIEETDLASPTDIAEKVAEMIPAKQLRAVVAELLRDAVRNELTRVRSENRPAARPARRTHNPSSKVAAIREYGEKWRKRLRDRIHYGAGVEDWKLLADCTAADFRFAAGERRAHAAGAIANAVEFESFATALDTHKVSRFAELPESVQAELLGGEQAAA